MPQGEFLLINNNNTRTKFALADREGLSEHASLMSRDLEGSGIDELLRGWDYEKVVLASVVPVNVPLLELSQAGRPLVRVNHETRLGI